VKFQPARGEPNYFESGLRPFPTIQSEFSYWIESLCFLLLMNHGQWWKSLKYLSRLGRLLFFWSSRQPGHESPREKGAIRNQDKSLLEHGLSHLRPYSPELLGNQLRFIPNPFHLSYSSPSNHRANKPFSSESPWAFSGPSAASSLLLSDFIRGLWIPDSSNSPIGKSSQPGFP